jgi:carbon-monoxide dehydrogenase large subunit
VTLPDQPTTVNPLGVKGAGQAGFSAIIRAILDALASLGIDHIDMPAAPSRARAARGRRRADDQICSGRSP